MNSFITLILTAVSYICFLFAFTNRVHMFQLNAYKYVFMRDWIKNNLAVNSAKAILPMLSAVICFIFGGGWLALLSLIPNIAFLLLHLPKKAKKPLVFTARVKRLYITATILFIFLGVLSFISASYGIYLLICQLMLIFPSYSVIVVNLANRPAENAVRRKYINEAKRKIASLPNLIVIGITGSYGKTGTKYILNTLLSEKYNTLMTPASYNTTMGVVKVIRENLTAAHDIFICEMGARSRGEIKEICDIVKPKYGIITSIGPCHLETFGSIENIIKTKFELYDALPEDGIIFLNADNEYLASKTELTKKAVYYGIQNKEKADYTADILSLSENGTSFSVCYGGQSLKLSTKLLGAHNILNVTGCVAVSKALGVSDDSLILGARRIEGAPHRLSLIKGQGFVIIDDSFNSNPGGARAALEVLNGFEGRKIIITPGMIELGEKQDEYNRKFGEEAAQICDYIFLIGEKQTRAIKQGVLSAGFDQNKLMIFENVITAIETAKTLPGSSRNVILIENDLPDNF
jgi:UDP-N-acetylmuramoyl-tripeptide--D-alanyl-D-alanine ligase